MISPGSSASSASSASSELTDDYLMSLFTFQDFGARKTSYNRRIGDWELSFLVIFGVFMFYIIYFLRKPQRILMLLSDLFSESASNKSHKMAKSAFKEGLSFVKSRLIKVMKAV